MCALLIVGGGTHAAAAQGPNLLSSFSVRDDANSRDGAVVAWNGPAGIRAASGTRAGGLASRVLLSGPDANGTPGVAIDDNGDAIVVWETTQQLDRAPCTRCGPATVSTGVWAAMLTPGAGFAPPIRLAGPQRVTGADFQVADPKLAMSVSGQAVIAWSDPDGAVVASRSPGGVIGAPERVEPAGFSVASAAVAGDGEAFLATGGGAVATRPPGGSFGAPVPLPGSTGGQVALAADAGGDLVAGYSGLHRLLLSRRPAGGGWSQPQVLTSIEGAAVRSAASSDTGAAAVTFAQSTGDPSNGGRGNLLAAIAPPGAPLTVEPVGDLSRDSDTGFDGAGIDMDGVGDLVIALHQSDGLLAPRVAQLAYRAAPGPFQRGTLTPQAAREPVGDGGGDVAFGAEGDFLTTWVDRSPAEDRVMAEWAGSGAVDPPLTLDQAMVRDFVLPLPSGHAAQITTQPYRRPDARGRIRVGLRCLSFDRKACHGTVTLTAEPQRWRAGLARFAVPAGTAQRVLVTLEPRVRRLLRRRGRIVLRAHAATTAPGGTFGGTTGRLVVKIT